MDLWVVAVAAGAGYLAKYWQNLSRERGEAFPGLSSANAITKKSASPSLVQQVRDLTCPLQNLAQTKLQTQPDSSIGSENSLNRRVGEMKQVDNPSSTEMATMSGYLNQGYTLNDGDNSVLSPAGPSSYTNQEHMDRLRLDSGVWVNVGDKSESSIRGMSMLHGSRRGKSSLRSRHFNLQFINPLSSLESCLIAQLYKERAELEESVFSTLPCTCTPTLRPFVVTDGCRMISRQSGDSFSVQLKNEREKLQREFLLETDEDVIGVPPLPAVGSVEGLGDQKLKKGKNRIEELSKSHGRLRTVQLHAQRSPSEAVLLCLGISIGIISSIVANKREIAKLKELLKQTENLVQDLQEELEMKDSLTVKELVNEDSVLQHPYESCAENKIPLILNRPSGFAVVIVHGGDEASNIQKTAENLDPMYKIEAELEAELERLELNMKGSTVQGRDDYELKPDLMAELVEGELRTDLIRRRPYSDHSIASSSSTEPPHSAKGAVSPHELCLRLHKVAESRLEQRIAELEAELERRQKRVEGLESEQPLSISWGGFFSHSDESSSSAQDSPVTIEARPSSLVMNLAGEALDAYNEAYEELKNVQICKNQESDFEARREIQEEEMFLPSQNGSGNSSLPFLVGCAIDDELERCGLDEDEIKTDSFVDNDEDDDMTKLIKQIVERTRQGSPAVLHAHRAMVSLDKSER